MLADVFANNSGLLIFLGSMMLFKLTDRDGDFMKAAKNKLGKALIRWLK